MKISQQETYRLTNIVSIVCFCLLVILILYIPQISRIRSRGTKICQLQKSLALLEQIAATPDAFQKQKDTLDQQLIEIEEKIPQLPLIAQVIKQISKPAKDLGISLTSIKPYEATKKSIFKDDLLSGDEPPAESEFPELELDDATTKQGEYLETPIDISINATYPQLGEYLDQLQHLPRLVVIDEFSIINNDKGTPDLNINLKISVFHYEKD